MWPRNCLTKGDPRWKSDALDMCCCSPPVLPHRVFLRVVCPLPFTLPHFGYLWQQQVNNTTLHRFHTTSKGDLKASLNPSSSVFDASTVPSVAHSQPQEAGQAFPPSCALHSCRQWRWQVCRQVKHVSVRPVQRTRTIPSAIRVIVTPYTVWTPLTSQRQMAKDTWRGPPSLMARIAPAGRSSIQWLLALRARELETQNVLAVIIDAAQPAYQVDIAPVDSRLGQLEDPGPLQWQLKSKKEIRV